MWFRSHHQISLRAVTAAHSSALRRKCGRVTLLTGVTKTIPLYVALITRLLYDGDGWQDPVATKDQDIDALPFIHHHENQYHSNGSELAT